MDEDDIKGGEVPTGPVMGPTYLMWETTLEKLKVLNYENGYCVGKGKKQFSRIHFVFPASNLSQQFDDFVGICEWLFTEITSDSSFFKRDQYDDPNTVANKMLLALRQVDFRLSFPAQKLRQANGENVCSVIEFLADKALEAKRFKWELPSYGAVGKSSQVVSNDDENDEEEIIQDEVAEDEGFTEDVGGGLDAGAELNESQLESSGRQMLHGQIDPIEWKIELERVSQKLKTAQVVSANEWRAHVDQAVTSKENITKILSDGKGELNTLNHDVTDELNRLKVKERYINSQFSLLSNEYKEIKLKLEESEAKCAKSNAVVSKFTTELADINEKLEDLKESFESKDNGMHDTSPLVRIKTALQHLKAEIAIQDLRTGVIAHSLLAARVASANRKRTGVAKNAKKRHNRNRKGLGSTIDAVKDDNSSLASDENDYE